MAPLSTAIRFSTELAAKAIMVRQVKRIRRIVSAVWNTEVANGKSRFKV